MTKAAKKKKKMKIVAPVVILASAVFISYFMARIITDNRCNYPSNWECVEVVEGDTLWEISKDHMPEGYDVRKTVDIIREKNGIDADLRIGQVILVPSEEVR